MDEIQNNYSFGIIDFVVFGGSLLIAILIGIYYAIKDRRKNNTDAYYFGERRMSPIPLGLSTAVTFISAIMIIGFPTETYLFGMVFLWFCLSNIIPTMVACLLHIPLVHRLQLTTINEYLELRFHPKVRKSTSVIACFTSVLYISTTVYVPALALSAVTPFGLKTTVIMTSFVCTFYTTLGGMKAVVWTDTLQSLVMLVGSVAVLIRTTMLVGGFSNVWDALDRGERLNVFNFNPDPTIRNSFWTIIVGIAFMGSQPSQALIQRYLSCDSITQARKAAVVAGVSKSIFTIVSVLNGAAMYAYYEDCDPLMSHKIQKPDQMMPYLVVDIFQDLPGLAGLYVAAGFSATLSTVSSGINSLAVQLVEDFIISKKPNLTEAVKTTISKIIVLSFGVVVMSFALGIEYLDGTVIRILHTFSGAIGGPVLGLFTLGLFFPWATTKGAIIGQLVATMVSLWIGLCSFLYGTSPISNRSLPASVDGCFDTMTLNTTQALVTTEHFQQSSFASTAEPESQGIETTLYAMSYLYYLPFSMIVTVCVGLIVSFITGPNKPAEADPTLFIPIISNPVFPAKLRNFFRFGVPHHSSSNEDKAREDNDILENFTPVPDTCKEEEFRIDDHMNVKDTEV